MQLTVISWFKESLITFIGRLIEVLFRVILCLLPLGVYMLLLQKRKKTSTISTIRVYTKDDSRWQHVFPGFILVSIDPNSLDNFFTKINSDTQNWIMQHKYVLALLFMSTIVFLMVLSYVRGGLL